MLFGQEHVDRYVETDGDERHDWQGTTALILWTQMKTDREIPVVVLERASD